MSATIQIAYNAVVAKIVNPTAEVKNVVSNVLSYMVEGVEHMGAFKSGHWNGRSTFFAHGKSTFPAGFTHLVHAELVRYGYKVQFVRKPLPSPLGPANPIVDEFGNDDPRYDYQMQTIEALLKHGRGIAQIATGGGKSKIAKLAIARIRRMTLFVTTRSVLLYQMKKALEKSGFGVGMLGDGEFTPRQGVNVAMIQTLIARLKETTVGDERRALIARHTNKGKEITGIDQEALQKEAVANFERKTLLRDQTIAFLNQVEFVIGEEAHEAGGNSYYEILQHCKNASYRLALTATPFMRENAEDNMRLMAAFGPVLIQVSEQTLIDRGILARPFFKFIRCDKPPKLFRTTPWQRAYKIGIVENMFRNAHIIREARRAVAAKMPVMILVQRKDHGTWLAKAFEKFGVKARFIQGETDETGRQKALKELGNGKLQILIGTTILDVGVDVPSVSMVILAGGGKAEVALRQRIGRGLRAKKGANFTFVVDFADNDNITLKEHAMTRRAIVEATPGFAENILPEGKDFDWSLFEAAKAA